MIWQHGLSGMHTHLVSHLFSPVNDDGVRGGVILVPTGTVFQAAATDELMSQQYTTEVGILACTLIKHQLKKIDKDFVSVGG